MNDEAQRGPGPDEPAGGPPGQGGRPPRRRGRRGRGGGRPPQGQPFRPGPRPPESEDEGSSQLRELAAYERRQQQQQQRGFRAPGQWRAPQRRFGGTAGRTGYADAIRRATGPRTAAPSHDAGEPIAGPHPVLEALRAGRQIRRLYVSQDRGLRSGAVNDVIREAQERQVMVRFVDRLEIARLSPIEEHQGVVAIAAGRSGVELDELLLNLEALDHAPLMLVVDSLQDPQNFGVLLRSAEGAGVDGIVIPRHRAVGITPAVAKTSAGASEHLLIADVANLRQAIDALKEKGVWVVATDESGDLMYDEVDYRGATAIVVGGEGEGIRRLVLEGCDQVVRIPMRGQVSSLNAAAAGTLVLYEALRQRLRDVPPAEPPARPPAAGPDATPGEGEELLADDETATGDQVRGDDQDVAEFEREEQNSE